MLVKKTDWVLRKALSRDTEKIKESFKRNLWLGKTNPETLFQWKYERNPLGETLALIAENSQKDVVATSMFIPVTLNLKDKLIRSYQWVDLFVELEYRGQSIADKTLHMGLDEAKIKDALICFAFPNQNSVPVHRKNNGYLLGYIFRFTKLLNAEYIAARFIKTTFLVKLTSFMANIVLRLISQETYLFNIAGYKTEEVKHCGQDFDIFWEKFTKFNHDKVVVKKNSAYLNWKYLGSPNKNRPIFALRKHNALCGFIVLECAGAIGYIVDVAALSKPALHWLIKTAIEYFRKNKMDSIVFIALENHPYINTFGRFDFVERQEKNHFYIYLLGEETSHREFVQNSQNWMVTIGDCDVESL